MSIDKYDDPLSTPEDRERIKNTERIITLIIGWGVIICFGTAIIIHLLQMIEIIN